MIEKIKNINGWKKILIVTEINSTNADNAKNLDDAVWVYNGVIIKLITIRKRRSLS